MAPLLYELQRYRFLLIVGGVLGVFFMGKMMTSSPVELSTLAELRAGEDASVSVHAGSNETLTFVLNKPDDTEVKLEAKTKEDGTVKLNLKGKDLEEAGTYTLSAGRWYSKNTVQEEFEVEANIASGSTSRVSFSQNSIAVGQSAQMAVLLKDEFGNPISGHSLTVTPSQASVEVYTSEFATNEKGQMNFVVSGSGAGVVSLTLFDSTEGQGILGPTQVAFSDSSNGAVHLASSGQVSSFSLTGISSQTLASEQESVTVKALDESGFTVTDYTGTIRFSSTDSEAALPDDYTFTADDQGEHTFSLSIKLITPGAQTLSVTDSDDTSVKGSSSTTVVTTLDSSTSDNATDYNSDFETTDFTRDGDFTLISPASGSYSSNTVEVQGEGEYGNTAVIFVNDQEVGRADIAFDNSFSYTLQDLSDGSYDVFVKIQDKNDLVLESSDTETITVDTTAPTLNSISSSPDTGLEAGSTVTITVLSETDLESATLVFQDAVTTMEETNTPGKYQGELVLPSTEGEYSLDVDLMDALGNEAQYRDQLTLTVGASTATEPVTDPVSTTPELGQVSGLTATPAEEKVALSWETPASSSTIAYYRIYYGPSSSALYAVSETYDSSTTWAIPDLTANQAYYFAVAAVDVEGTEGTLSDVAMAVPELSQTPVVTTPIIETPAITTSGAAITETPESGPALDIFVILSVAGALSYVLLRKSAQA